MLGTGVLPKMLGSNVFAHNGRVSFFAHGVRVIFFLYSKLGTGLGLELGFRVNVLCTVANDKQYYFSLPLSGCEQLPDIFGPVSSRTQNKGKDKQTRNGTCSQ